MNIVIYFQNPEICDEQAYWIRDEDESVPTSIDDCDGWIGGRNGDPSQYRLTGQSDDDVLVRNFAKRRLGLKGPIKWQYIDIDD